MSRREKSGTSWRFEVANGVLTASNKAMIYTVQIGVPYAPNEHSRAMSKGPIGPRIVTQFLDGGSRLYTTGVVGSTRGGNTRVPARTVATVSSFVGTYKVPRVPVVPELASPGPAEVHDDDRFARLEQSVAEALTLLRALTAALGGIK